MLTAKVTVNARLSSYPTNPFYISLHAKSWKHFETMKTNKEVRSVSLPTKNIEVRTRADGKREIKGVAIVANSLSEDLGGFKEKLTVQAIRDAYNATSDCLLLYNHDIGRLLSRQSSKTLKLSIDGSGNLAFVATLADNALADEVLSLLARKDLRNMSFGFQCVSDLWDEMNGQIIRTVTAFNLAEISIVAWPAYAASEASLRSCPESLRAKLRSKDDENLDDDDDSEDDKEDDECRCDCAACFTDNCEGCTDDDCNDDECFASLCPMQDERRADSIRVRRLFSSLRN